MKYEECKTLEDVARALNDDKSDSLDVAAYCEAVKRVGAVDLPSIQFLAARDVGGCMVEVLTCDERFHVVELEADRLPANLIEELRGAKK